MSVLIMLADVRKRFGDRELFHIERVSLEQGRSYVLTGPNGSGKTTLLRMLAGLEPAQTGRFVFRDAPVHFAPHYPERLRRALAAELPDHMVPAAIVLLEALPLTHYLRIVRSIMLKGSTLADLRYDTIGLAVLMLIAMLIAVTRFRRTLD